ncbi:hypothetical protein BLM37_01105 [Candidatus Gracilibacteria bacterium GN02-873]|nr:hypothetical protein BLM37_01105 [Candidatus Gracilibacteria bacterium GN02-873]
MELIMKNVVPCEKYVAREYPHHKKLFHAYIGSLSHIFQASLLQGIEVSKKRKCQFPKIKLKIIIPIITLVIK